MLPRQYRLKKRNAFNATYRTGISFHQNGITVFCGKNKTKDIPTKIGFVVSKKVHKRAVKRNRIKRLMRENVRLFIKKTPEFDTKYISIIFVGTNKLLDKNFYEIQNCIEKLMRKVRNA